MTNPPLLLVGNFLSAGRPYRSPCEELAMRLSRRNWTVITTSDQQQPLLRLADMVRTVSQRKKEYSVANVDVFSGRAFLWATVVCAALRRVSRPYTLTLHGGSLPEFARKYPRRVRRLFNTAQALTAPSRYLHEQMSAYSNKIQLLPNAVDLNAYSFQTRRPLQPKLTWLRAFHAIYNPAMAVRALALLTQDFPSVHLTMIGPDKGDGSWQQTRALAEALGVLDRLCMPGGINKSEVPSWLGQADIFLNTTNVDNTPISVLEAMACGLCIVTTNVGGLPYLVEEGKDALLIPPDHTDALVEAVRLLLTTPHLAETLSRTARAKATKHDWSVVLPQWEELLRRAMSDG